MNKAIFMISVCTLSIILISSCKKTDVIGDSNTTAASDYAMEQSYYSDVLEMSTEAIEYANDPSFAITYNCATISLDTTAGSFYPVKATLSFNDQCLSFDGRKRSGSISVTMTGAYDDPNTVVTTICNNYSVNNNSIGGTLTLTAPVKSGSSLNETVTISNGEVHLNDGTNATLNATFSFEWQNYGDLDYTDDVLLISGNASGTSTDGLTYTVSITSPITLASSCKYIATGIIKITPQGMTARTVDFGDGTCDNDITVTIDGKDFVVQVRE